MALSTLKSTLSRVFNRTPVVAPPESPELYLKLTTKCMEQANMMASSCVSSPKFNHEQCKHLAHKLKMAVQNAHLYLEQIKTWYSMFASPLDMKQSLEIFKLLFVLGKEVESFIQSCCKDEWIQSAIMLTNASEQISTIGFKLEFCTIVFTKRKNLGATPSLTPTEVASARQAEAEIVKAKSNIDERRLYMDLSVLIQRSTSSSAEWQMATFLLERLKSARLHLGSDLPGSFESTSQFDIMVRSLKQKEKLGKGVSGTVYKATWLGADVAKKTFYGPDNPDFVQEVTILTGLYHPGIVDMFWYMTDEDKCHIIMELMDEDLNTLIEKRLAENELKDCGSRGSPFTISESVDIMMQVAEGVLFLHEKKIVHRDLKSNNILVRCMKSAEVDIKFVQAKVADFGLSKTKERSMTYSNQTQNVGTTRWMAPEMIKIKNSNGQAESSQPQMKYPFKSDVYSFGMVCYEILTGHVPFAKLGPNEVKTKVLGGSRPQLPDHCPSKLKTLIEACWSSEVSARPDFVDICAELRQIKCIHFMTSAWTKVPRCFSLEEIKSMLNVFSGDSNQGLSRVYRGFLVETGEVVVVHRIDGSLDDDSTRAIMKLLLGLHHDNISRCVGFCYEKGERILVQFMGMPKSTLWDWQAGDKNDVNHKWLCRKKICFGVVNGINYLHAVCVPRIIHCDIHPSYIMLDANLEPKIIVGFGSPMLCPDEVSREHEECRVRPFNEEVDVFNCGVVLLELLSGRSSGYFTLGPSRCLSRQFWEWAWALLSEGKYKDIIDPCLDLYPDEEMEAVRMIKIAFLCMHYVLVTQPDMSLVVEMLHGNRDPEISENVKELIQLLTNADTWQCPRQIE